MSNKMIMQKSFSVPETQLQPVLFSHQQEGIENTSNELSIADKCKIIMACGTGKTRIGPELALSLKALTVVVYLPSLTLVRQTLPEWFKAHFSQGMSFLCVCSDDTVADPINDDAVVTIDDLVEDFGVARNIVTTDPKCIHDFLDQPNTTVRVIFCTYQSCDTLRNGLPVNFRFDFGLFDEAHKTAGRNVAFSAPLNDSHTPISKRVFMTATPKHFDIRKHDKDGDSKLVYSMDDEAIYGRTAYNLPIRKAIELGVIAGYKVIISVIDDQEIARTLINNTVVDTQNEAIAHAIAIKKAMDEFGLKKAVTFHETVDDAEFFAGSVFIQKELGLPTFHVSGKMRTKDRSVIMESFASEEKALVTNARCLTEGVDVPAIDLIAFLHPKKSQVDIIQALGRALRIAKGSDKTTGYILLPIYVSGNGHDNLEQALEDYGYDTIFQVIQALREQDELVESSIQQFQINRIQNRLDATFDLSFLEVKSTWTGMQVDMIRNVISTRVVDYLMESWFTNFAFLQEIFISTGNSNIEKKLIYKNINIGFWCSTQRAYYKKKILPNNRIKLLESIQFSWNKIDASWDAHYRSLSNIFKSTGSSNINTKLVVDGLKLGQWVLDQRKSRRNNKLSQVRLEKLEAINFSYDCNNDIWISSFNQLKAYYNVFGDVKVPVNYIDGDLKLGSWLSEQQKRYNKGILSQDKIEMLNSINISWDRLEDKWMDNFLVLKNIFIKNGNTNITDKYTENGLAIGQWLSTQRSLSHAGQLIVSRKEMLISIGVNFEYQQNSWEDNFKIFSDFWQTQNGLEDASHPFYKNNRTRDWLLRQRSKYKLGKLSDDKVKKLKAVQAI